MAKLSLATSQALQMAKDGIGPSNSDSNGLVEECPKCQARFNSVIALVEHVEKVHEKAGDRAGVKKVRIDACPKCSRGF
nr:TPA_asm: hypothetical protein HUJ06_000618 [Nelumbo nucifera]